MIGSPPPSTAPTAPLLGGPRSGTLHDHSPTIRRSLAKLDGEGDPHTNDNDDAPLELLLSSTLADDAAIDEPRGRLRRTFALATPEGLYEDEGAKERWRPLGSPVRLHAGARVPGTRYELIQWLGEGGMGVVYEARHVDLRRPIALKILKQPVANRERATERFLNEARTIAGIDSPWVVDVLDFGELPDGRPFYTMELLEPDSVYTELAGHTRLPLARTLAILRQCCKALAAVHDERVAHRDLKPENVLLQRDGQRKDCVRLVDFGIAAPFGSHPRVAGTLLYMAPEQLRDQAFDGRADIYALGCMAMEMLTGEPPFRAANPAAQVNAHLDREPPKLSQRRPDLPASLERVIDTCLAKRPSDRYANVDELEAALCEVQIDAGLATEWDELPLPRVDAERQASLARRMPRRRRRRRRQVNRRVMVACAAFCVGVLAAMVGSISTAEPQPPVDAAHAADVDSIDDLVAQARAAGSRASWVYPPADDPDAPTALSLVNELEQVEGTAALLASLRASTLRHEFSLTLARLGDRYWGEPHGRPFAVEFYAQALLFDPSLERARERVGLSTPQLVELGERLARGQHTQFDRELGATLGVLAEHDEGRRAARASKLLADADQRPTSLRVNNELAQLVGVSESGVGGRVKPAAQIEHATPTTAKPEASDPAPSGPSKADIAAEVETLNRKGKRALSWGARGRAHELFKQALELDPSDASALAGIARVHFARGHYERAFKLARKAARRAPRDADVQLLLGDASYKTGRVGAARKAYRSADQLGHGKAARRLRMLDEDGVQ